MRNRERFIEQGCFGAAGSAIGELEQQFKVILNIFRLQSRQRRLIVQQDSSRLAPKIQGALGLTGCTFDAVRLFQAGQVIVAAPVWKGSAREAKLGAGGAVIVSVPAGEAAKVQTRVERTDPLIAPLDAGQRVGTLKVNLASGATVAERPLDAKQFPSLPRDKLLPGSLVFRQPDHVRDMVDLSQWWAWTPGAHWRAPEGPGSSIRGRENHPVVHIAFEDAMAYARWARQDLPTEAEWEYAARGGLAEADYTWTEQQRKQSIKPLANHWQGLFPVKNLNEDGYSGTAPVGCFVPNGFGLFDMAGNVWEVTKDEYADANGPYVGMKVAKGGSFLCADNFCGRYRPAARTPHGIDTGMQHVGFRTVWRGPAKSRP